jgi:DNA-binding transcriptional LysR family regulator
LVAAGLGVRVLPGLAASAVRADVALVGVRAERPLVRAVALATRAGTDAPPPAPAFAEMLHGVAADLKLELQRRIKDP